MSTKTNTPAQKPKKKGPLAIAFEKIKALEEKVNAPHKCPVANLNTVPQRYQFTGRVDRPSYGQALPVGVCFHSYVTVRTEDQVVDEKIVVPSEVEVLTLLRAEANEKFPDNVGVEIADISILPVGW